MSSIWFRSCEIGERECLHGDIEVETAVIGAGMAGILTAYELQNCGKQVAVLEASRIASGQTRNTTAKITIQHGLIYHKLMSRFGKHTAADYAAANQCAIDEYRRIIERDNIDCDFEEKCSYIYSQSSESLKKETRAVLSMKLPAEFVRDIPVNIPCCGAVKFKNQAQFNPMEFIRAVSEHLTIYENTAVRAVKGNVLITNHGNVRAKNIVFACHYPFVNFPGLYFARMHQERSYVLALEYAKPVGGVIMGDEIGTYSFRNYGKLLLLGGEGHRTGENTDGGCYDRLRAKAGELFPGSREVAHWSAQDCITADGVPYIGRYSSGKPNWYVATGFGKWGMTSSMVSAMILRDAICGVKNKYAYVFAPSRFSAKDVPRIAFESGHAVKGLTRQIFSVPSKAVSAIKPGHGGVVSLRGRKAGVYKDESGKIHAVDIRCPHLGCQLEWNPDELSWDCPCHGSRFDFKGNLLDNPAQNNLNHKK